MNKSRLGWFPSAINFVLASPAIRASIQLVRDCRFREGHFLKFECEKRGGRIKIVKTHQ